MIFSCEGSTYVSSLPKIKINKQKAKLGVVLDYVWAVGNLLIAVTEEYKCHSVAYSIGCSKAERVIATCIRQSDPITIGWPPRDVVRDYAEV
jgi:hypothetical protein